MQIGKKVLVAIPCLMLGGTEYQTLNLVKALAENGYTVTVLCYFEYDMTMVKYMEDAGADVILMTESAVRPKKFLKLFMALFSGFRKALKKVKPDVVHVQYMAPGSLTILLFKLLGVKIVIATAHTPGHIYKRKWIPQLIAKYLTESFLCVSKSSEESFFDEEAQEFSKESFSEGRKHFTIYNCVEIDQNNVHVANENSDIFTIGIVSRLSYEKGVDIMISAMPMILKNYPNIKLLVVGDGAEKERLYDLVMKLEVSDVITWAGLQPKDELAGYYAQMDLVAVPSRFEGFGLTAIEAMSYEIPVIASNIDGLREVIEDSISGILVKNESSEAYAKEIIGLIKDPVRMKTLGKNSRVRVLENFSFKIYEKSISNMYSSLISDIHR